MNQETILNWLKTTRKTRLAELWEAADKIRYEKVGDAVHLRGLIEISNYCSRNCAYCGISRDNQKVERYRMTEQEIMECVHKGQRQQAGFFKVCTGLG